jgi:hypothetical protein
VALFVLFGTPALGIGLGGIGLTLRLRRRGASSQRQKQVMTGTLLVAGAAILAAILAGADATSPRPGGPQPLVRGGHDHPRRGHARGADPLVPVPATSLAP